MSIIPADLIFLQSGQGANLLQDLARRDLSQSALLPLITDLRKTYSQQEIHAAVTMAQLRQKAVDKYSEDAARLFFTDDALQQASDARIRQYRSQHVSGLRILDICCGIGTDSIAFARAGAMVHAIDLDETRIQIAQYNANALDLDITFEVADATQLDDLSRYDLIFFDPARRNADGRRIYDVEKYIPPLSLIHQWDVPRIMVKISPGVDLDQLADYNATVEFISVNGDLKEAVLHIPETVPYRATMFNSATGWLTWDNDYNDNEIDVKVAEPAGWLYEPDPAILRANLVKPLAARESATMIDPTIAFFCTPRHQYVEEARAWKIRDWMPFNLKKLRARLREMDIGTLTVKKRGSPISPEELIRKLKLKGSQSATVVLTRYDGDPVAIICDDIQ